MLRYLIKFAPCIALLLASLAGCSPSEQQTGENNPFYKRGIRLRTQSHYQEACEAFQQCLRQNPDADQAHLQLALIYDDHLSDPLRAILHYRAFLERNPSGQATTLAQQSLIKAEQALVRELATRYGTHTNTVSTPPPQPTPTRQKGGVTPRERQLALTVKQLARELATLRSVPPSKRIKITLPPTSAPYATTVQPRKDTSNTHYTVRHGDTLSKVAKHFYGKSSYWTALRDYNTKVLNGSDALYPGMQLTIPPLHELIKTSQRSQ